MGAALAYVFFVTFGAVGTYLLDVAFFGKAGILFWGDSAGLRKFFYLTLIVASIVVLKLAG